MRRFVRPTSLRVVSHADVSPGIWYVSTGSILFVPYPSAAMSSTSPAR